MQERRERSLRPGAAEFAQKLDTLNASRMSDIIYIVRYKGNTDPTDRSTQEVVRADHVEVDGDRVIFMRSDGSLAAFFDKTVILDWREATEGEVAI
jgi:hypothetical protein